MGNDENERATKVGDILFRYMRARHRFKDKVEQPLPSHELAALIDGGKTEFDEIYIEADANPPIVLDGRADDVFHAIIKKRYRAIPFFDPQLVAAWRHYVIGDGPMPRRPGPSRSHDPALVEPCTPTAMPNGEDGLDVENARCAWVNRDGFDSTVRQLRKPQVD
jgi:hypothetical protein